MRRKLENIVLIGPVYPYKGGISHYTGLMYKSLNKKWHVDMISFKMQYPKILFHKEQKDYENDTFKIAKTKFWINTVNPFNWVKTTAKIRELQPNLIIFQWWHPYFSPCYWMMCKMLTKVPVLFICHNVFPHERFPLDRFLSKITLKQGDYFITQSGMDTKNLLSIKKDANYIQAVHPTYNVFKFKNMSKLQARQLLHLSETDKVLLFFGFVREYKGLKYLLKALPFLKTTLSDIKLLVVGDFGNDKKSYIDLINKLDVEDVLEIYDGYIPDKEVEKFFASCDLVVLPYESATQSGIVQIAYGFERPVIVTRVGGLPDVVIDDKTGYVVNPCNPQEIAKAVEKYFIENKERKFRDYIQEEKYKYSWDRMVEHIEKLCFKSENED